jgi:hypothetical protein
MSKIMIDITKGLLNEQSTITYNADCIRKKSNMTHTSAEYRFDHPSFNPVQLKQDIPLLSPKLDYLLNHIAKLDATDLKTHHKKFKHFIFSDLKMAPYGAKLITSAFIANGYTLGYSQNNKSIQLLSDEELKKSNSAFYLLSSISVYEKPLPVKVRKDILSNFNKRPDNIHGENVRFIITDGGFKEGIDLFDIKYIHIFEPSVNPSDQKQVIGRGTRTCGQKGLQFHPTKGWPLHVFVYDLEFPEKYKDKFLNTNSAFELYMKSMNLDFRKLTFVQEIENLSIYGSTDYELNLPVHEFSNITHNEEMSLIGGGLKIQVSNRPFIKIRKLIHDHYSKYKWASVKMENMCVDKSADKSAEKKGGAPTMMEYTPTQNFISNYFSPEAPVKGMLLWHSTGTGKCHAKDTPILMYDGSVKLVQDIDVGELLMGDDSTPRKVLSLATGTDELYDIIPTQGDTYRVNSVHILCLKPSPAKISRILSADETILYSVKYIEVDNHGDKPQRIRLKKKLFYTKSEAVEYREQKYKQDTIIEIEVKDYLNLPKYIKCSLNGYRTGVDFQKQSLSIDPYFVGYWLGKGRKSTWLYGNEKLTTKDPEVIHYLHEFCEKNEYRLKYNEPHQYYISPINKTNTELIILKELIKNRHIPEDYKINNRENRIEVLAGLIDAIGYYNKQSNQYIINEKNAILVDDILFICRSLGLNSYKNKTANYFRIYITGEGMEQIPVKILRKQIPRETPKRIHGDLTYNIKVNPTGRGNYYGFTLDNNHRYLLGDFTVTHNTCTAIAAATRGFETQDYTVLWVTRTTLKNDIWKNMFQQICSESIKSNIDKLPADLSNQKRMLSKSWMIKPLSYKQFSNLVSRENAYYKRLVQINGSEDPLRKTLLIIDEAHKLYGGGDLSSIERPDMVALHKAVMHSYAVSGKDSVRILLMTATPITLDGMELIKLLNLCRPIQEQLPASFETFQEKYLTNTGVFTKEGREMYLDDIAGYLSYLNREKDARQFSQPVIKRILVPILKDTSIVDKFEKATEEERKISELSEETEKLREELQGEIQEINPARFAHLTIKCDSKKIRPSKCKKIVKTQIRELVKELKAYKKYLSHMLKELKEKIKISTVFKKDQIKKIKENIKRYPEEYAEYKKTPFFLIKSECSNERKSNADILEDLQENPTILKFKKEVKEHEMQIQQMKDSLKIHMNSYKIKQREFNMKLKNSNEYTDKNVYGYLKRDTKDRNAKEVKILNKQISDRIEIHNKSIKSLKHQEQLMYKKVRESLKKSLKIDQKTRKKMRKEEVRLKKIQSKRGEYMEIVNERIKDIVDKKQTELDRILSMAEENESMNIQKKEEEKTRKNREKEEKKMEKQQEKEEEKTRKNREKEEKKMEKKQKMDQEKTRKNREKEIKNMNKIK